MSEKHPRGRDVSQELGEVRTVLSRAETAIRAVVNLSYRGNLQGDWWCPEPSGEEPDPDTEKMYADLDVVVDILDRWRKTGRTRGRDS